MNRLTVSVKLPEEGTFREYSYEESRELQRMGDVSEKELYRRLQAYEDTGLTPEEIIALKADNENLHKLVDAVQKILWNDTEEEE